jgi:RNA polymerase sigma factor (sigma-70 family)
MIDQLWTSSRPRLFGIARRVLHDAGDAEDVVQETWIRWNGADRSAVASPYAFLAVTTTRLAINVASSARRRRETAASTWLPDAVDRGPGPEVVAERYEAVDAGIRLLLERLTPAEVTAFLLRRAFDHPYARIAGLLGVSAGNARQLVTRAGRHLASDRRQPVDPVAHRRLVRTFLAAAQAGDLSELEQLLTP